MVQNLNQLHKYIYARRALLLCSLEKQPSLKLKPRPKQLLGYLLLPLQLLG
jgi:hypothetical protein